MSSAGFGVFCAGCRRGSDTLGRRGWGWGARRQSESVQVKGDGQECPSYTSLSHAGQLEHAGVVLLQSDLVGVFAGLVFGRQLAILLPVAVDLVMQSGFFGFEMSALAVGQLPGF